MSRKDALIMDGLVINLIEGKISAQEIIDKELVNKVKHSWLY